MNQAQYIKTVVGVLFGLLLIWIGVTGKLGSVLGALITPDAMQDDSAAPAQATESTDPNSVPTTPGATLSPVQIGALAYNAGIISAGALALSIAIAMAESGGKVSVTHTNANGSTDYGLWQINGRAHPQYDPAKLVSIASYNASAMFAISNAGTDWGPWTTFTSGAFKQYLAQANTAAAQVIQLNTGR